MKKIALLLTATLTLIGCNTGVYSVSSGMPDESAICFVAAKKYDINVNVDGKNYTTQTVKQKPHKARRDVKKNAAYSIPITPGSHNVKVTSESNEIYSRTIFVSANETKIIEL